MWLNRRVLPFWGISLLISLPSTTHAASAAETACGQLTGALPSGSIVASSSNPSSPSALFEDLRNFNWAQNARLTPKCIILPASTAELSKTLKTICSTSASFAVRSGGHNPNPGWANIDGGVLIDLRKFNEVTYKQDQGAVVIGSGKTWGEVYTTLQDQGITVIGGRVWPVGVGGLLLGGGLSYLTHRHGVPADNVVNFEVVLADGRILNASARENSDLYWALKGGTSNFGIVTRFTTRAIPIGQVWGGYVEVPYTSTKDEVLDAAVKYQQLGDRDLDSELCLQFLPNNDTTWINMVYSKPQEWPDVFKSFRSLSDKKGRKNTMSKRPWVDFIAGQPGFLINRFAIRTTAMKLDAETYKQAFAVCDQEKKALTGVNGATVLCVFQPISENVVDEGKKKGGNALGLEKTKQNWMGVVIGWNNAADDAKCYATADKIHDKIEALTKSKGKFLSYEFMSDAGRKDNVIASYGANNVEKLRTVARKYDPKGLFQKLEPGGFKIPGSMASSSIVEGDEVTHAETNGKDEL